MWGLWVWKNVVKLSKSGKGLTYPEVFLLTPVYIGVLLIFKEKSTLINLGHQNLPQPHKQV